MDKISVAIVTFNNKDMLAALLADLGQQTRLPDDIYVIDNASSDGTAQKIPPLFPHVHFVHLKENTGSSGGYHAAVKAAAQQSDFIWTLDDDVTVNPASLENLVKGFFDLQQKEPKVGAVRSIVSKAHRYNYPTPLEIAPWRGTLFKTAIVHEIGFPRDDYFLYGEDLEYSLRLRKAGYSIFWIPQSTCFEVRDEKTKDQFLGKRVRIYPSAFRLYYAFRNELTIFWQYRRFDKLFSVLFYLVKVVGFLVITERQKALNKITAITLGVWHAIQGRLGKNPAYLPGAP